MSATMTTIHAPGPGPTDDCIQRERKGQMEALQKVRRILGSTEPPKKADTVLEWARGIAPEYAHPEPGE